MMVDHVYSARKLERVNIIFIRIQMVHIYDKLNKLDTLTQIVFDQLADIKTTCRIKEYTKESMYDI